jgi:hypothetical protein
MRPDLSCKNLIRANVITRAKLVQTIILFVFPGLSLRSNPGLKLANAFGVFSKLTLTRARFCYARDSSQLDRA